MKAILVMEMPENCSECQLHLDICGGATVVCCGCDCENMERNILPNWCPLVPMPEHKEEMPLKEALSQPYKKGVSCGWNACLDAIERSGKSEKDK